MELGEVEKQIHPQEPFQFLVQGHSRRTPNHRILRKSVYIDNGSARCHTLGAKKVTWNLSSQILRSTLVT